jgi:hypothetical protein
LSALAQWRAQGNALRKLAKKREAIGFVGRVGMIGDEGLEDAFGDFRTFYITFAKIFSTAPAQVRPSRRMSGSPTFIPYCDGDLSGEATLVLNAPKLASFGGFVMLQRERPRGVRLGIDVEADALLSTSGMQAYSIALKRAEEASSDEMARDWSVVAATIARRSGRRSSLLDALFG